MLSTAEIILSLALAETKRQGLHNGNVYDDDQKQNITVRTTFKYAGVRTDYYKRKNTDTNKERFKLAGEL